MASELEDLPANARIALEWSTSPNPSDAGLFDDDPEIAERIRSLTAAILECGLTDNMRLLTDLLTVMGAVPPLVHGPLLILLGKEDPAAVSKAFRVLAAGSEAQRFAYRSLVETLGRFGRHSLVVDVMSNDDEVDRAKIALMRARGE